MLEQINIAGFNKIEVAINRLKTFEPPEGYYLAFSGGKDSIVIKELCNMAGVKYDSHYNITTVDPPELVQYIRKYHPEVERKHATYKDGKRVTMFNLISKNKFPPTRLMRYCCRYLKEGGGDGRFVVTGVRWAESAKRKNNRVDIKKQTSTNKANSFGALSTCACRVWYDADGKPVYDRWECSQCGYYAGEERPDWKFCPNCGNPMVKGEL